MGLVVPWANLLQPVVAKASGLDRPADGDLLPSLVEHVRSAGAGDSAASRRRLAWLEQRRAAGARLLPVWPSGGDAYRQALGRWLGPRLLWFSRPPVDCPLVAIASSRTGRAVSQQRGWLDALRDACASVDRAREVLLIAETTATARFVARCAERFRLDTFTVSSASPRCRTLDRWVDELRDKAEGSCVPDVSLSPLLLPLETQPSNGLETLPVADRALFALADRVVVLRARSGGVVGQLVALRDGESDLKPCTIADLAVPSERSRVAASVTVSGPQLFARLQERGIDFDEPWQWLTHWTRAAAGAWPDESESDYLDDLLFSELPADRSALGALSRIVEQRRLLATGRLTRGDEAVVSFTAVPLEDLVQRRVFRRHLARWDFEPYGICIRREWLTERGARPVQYGDEVLWRSLAATDRSYFQRRFSNGSRSRPAIDWSEEREWRHVGDIDLTPISAATAFLFVPTETEARLLGETSRWPVIPLE